MRWSKKPRSSCLSLSNAAKVYFSSASASAALSARSANAISGSIIQNSERWRLVFEFSARQVGLPSWECGPNALQHGGEPISQSCVFFGCNAGQQSQGSVDYALPTLG